MLPTAASPHTYCVAVDGSEAAHKAFVSALKLLQSRDRVVLLHVFAAEEGKEADDVPADVSAVVERYDVDLVAKLSKDRYEVVLLPQPDGKNTHDIVCDFVNGRPDVDFLVTGFVGVRGPRDDPRVLGSTADYSLRHAHCSSILIKDRLPVDDPPSFAVGVDGSDAADISVQAAQSIARPGAKVTIFHLFDAAKQGSLPESAKLDAVQEKYEMLAVMDPRLEFVAAELKHDKVEAQQICDLAESTGASFLVIGVDGLGAVAAGREARTLGSTTDYCVRHSGPSVICPQARGATYGK